MHARVPASSANLGPGFDTLGVALELWTEVTVTPSDRLHLTVTGEGSSFPLNSNHFAAKLARQVLGHDRLRIDITSEVPVARGLGSSAALGVGIVAACGHPDPLSFIGLLEGHADNAAACVLGGFVTGAIIDGRVVASRLPLDPALTFVVVIPERHLSTKDARQALPDHVPLPDAVFNLSRMGALIAGFADHRRLVRGAFDDRLHQAQRAPLFPESGRILTSLVDAGAFGATWSGAGPTLLATCHVDVASVVRDVGATALLDAGVPGRSLVVAPDRVGLVLTRENR